MSISKNVALNKPATQSSISQWSRASAVDLDAKGGNDGNYNRDYGFHTRREDNPWWQVDLGGLYSIESIMIFNRRDCAYRLKRFSILVSRDGIDWKTAFRKTDDLAFGGDGLPFMAKIDRNFARFVRIRLDGNEPLHFVECEVIAHDLTDDESDEVAVDAAEEHWQELLSLVRDIKSCKIEPEQVEALKMAITASYYGSEELWKEVESKPDRARAFAVAQTSARLMCGPNSVLTPHGFSQGFQSLSNEEKSSSLELIVKFMKLLNDNLKLNCYFSAGTLLGIVREGGLLGHDDDFDSSYLSNEYVRCNILLERWDIYRYIDSHPQLEIRDVTGGHFHVKWKGKNDFIFDLFTAWSEDGQVWQFPLTPKALVFDDILPLRQIMCYGVELPIPAKPEAMLAANYGSDWRIPDPSFRFRWDEVSADYDFLKQSKIGFDFFSIFAQEHSIFNGLPACSTHDADMTLDDIFNTDDELTAISAATKSASKISIPASIIQDGGNKNLCYPQLGEMLQLVARVNAGLRVLGRTCEGSLIVKVFSWDFPTVL